MHRFKNLASLLAPLALVLASISGGIAHATDAGATCQSLSAEQSQDKNYYNIVATGKADDGSKITGYLFDFGDRESYTFNFNKGLDKDRERAAVKHTYADEGNYTVTASVISTRDGKTAKYSSPECTIGLTIGNPPKVLPAQTTLPATGPEILPGLFANILASLATYVIVYLWTGKRSSQEK